MFELNSQSNYTPLFSAMYWLAGIGSVWATMFVSHLNSQFFERKHWTDGLMTMRSNSLNLTKSEWYYNGRTLKMILGEFDKLINLNVRKSQISSGISESCKTQKTKTIISVEHLCASCPFQFERSQWEPSRPTPRKVACVPLSTNRNKVLNTSRDKTVNPTN